MNISIEVLPPQEIPSNITVRVASKKLGDHLQSFINANNLSGYAYDPDYVLSPNKLTDLFLIIGSQESISLAVIKKYAWHIRTLTNKIIGVDKAYDLIARSLGYRTWYVAKYSRTADDIIFNVWLCGADLASKDIRECIFADKETRIRTKGSYAAELLKENHEMNLLRNRKKGKFK